MRSFTPRFVVGLTIILTAFCGPTGARAQAPVVANNSFTTVVGVAGYVSLNNLTIDPTGLDAASGAVQWFNDGRLMLGGGRPNGAFAPLVFSGDHTRIDGGTLGSWGSWCINPATGEWFGAHAYCEGDWYYDGSLAGIDGAAGI